MEYDPLIEATAAKYACPVAVVALIYYDRQRVREILNELDPLVITLEAIEAEIRRLEDEGI